MAGVRCNKCSFTADSSECLDILFNAGLAAESMEIMTGGEGGFLDFGMKMDNGPARGFNSKSVKCPSCGTTNKWVAN